LIRVAAIFHKIILSLKNQSTLNKKSMLGGMELLVICALLGGVCGYFFRNKSSKNGKLTGVLLGVVGALVITYILVTYVLQSYFLMPVYAVLGAWLFNFVAAKIK
jgi:uncharacterized membrane protein YeaQ/YmgE (transglycosylase-associated protein family)